MDTCQAMITRLPYDEVYRVQPIMDMVGFVDLRGLICISMPIHVEKPNNGGRLIWELEQAGLILVAKVAWYRDRHIVTTKSRRLTNTWEPLAIFSKSKNYVINRESATKIKKGFEGREGAFDEEEFKTCIGDHWPVRNDRRDRRFLPASVVLNCGQLADVQPGGRVLDPWGNPGVRDACAALNWEYVDGGYANEARRAKQANKKVEYDQDLFGLREDENPGCECDPEDGESCGSDTGAGWEADPVGEGGDEPPIDEGRSDGIPILPG
jgi:hypothetical protein